MESIRALRETLQTPRLAPGLHSPWWIERVSRVFSIYLTMLLLRTPITANGVTVLMFLTGVAGSLCFLSETWAGRLCGALLLQGSMIMDCCDGEVARYRGMSSLTGNYLDALSHYVVPALTLFCASLGVSRMAGEWWVAVGGIVALFLVWIDACYDLRFKAAYLGHRSRMLMAHRSPDLAAAGHDSPGGGGDSFRHGEEGRMSLVPALRTAGKFLFEPTAVFNIMGAAVLASKLCGLAWGGAAEAVPFRVVILLYAASAPPYFLLSTALTVRYRETELHEAALRRMFSK